MKKKLLSAVLSAAMVASVITGCGAKDTATTTPAADNTETKTEQAADNTDTATADKADETATADKADETATGNGKVYYLNFKPEQAQAWEALAAKYTEQTGVEVAVQTAASGTYESTLKSEIAKTEAPTLFQVNGPVGLSTWKDYCYDLSSSDIYSQVKSDDFVLKEGDEVKGIAYVVETYGIIYNADILNDYFGKDYAVVKSVDEINSFDKLKAVADSIQENKDDLGVKGAFTSAGMDSSSDWRFKTHLANLPLYFEYQADGIGTTTAIKGTYLDNYRQIFDLYINNSTCAPSEIAAKTGTDSENEFLDGKAVFFQNGSWEYGALSAKYSDDQLGMLPIYVGAGDEANQGLCTGTENYWCVNSKASKADIEATLDFLAWVVTSEKGTKAMAEDMGFVIPFKKALESANVFVKQDNAYTAAGKTPVSWNFPTMPSEAWKNGVGTALTAYAADQTDANWDAVVKAFVEGWKSEYELLGK